MNLLRLDLTKVRLDVVHANDKAIGTETVSSMAKRHGAFAAINGGFFRADDTIWAGDPAGVLIIDHELWSESYRDRSTLLINNGQTSTVVAFGLLNAFDTILHTDDREDIATGINRQREAGDIIVFSPAFGNSTKTAADGTEIVLSGCERVERVGCEHIEVLEKKGDSSIPPSGYVISVGPAAIGGAALIERFRKQVLSDKPCRVEIWQVLRNLSDNRIPRHLDFPRNTQ
jgi:hypothetical protein